MPVAGHHSFALVVAVQLRVQVEIGFSTTQHGARFGASVPVAPAEVHGPAGLAARGGEVVGYPAVVLVGSSGHVQVDVGEMHRAGVFDDLQRRAVVHEVAGNGP